MSEPSRALTPPPLVALLGWLIPGAGYWVLGDRRRALTVGITILALFFLGVLIGGVRVIEAPPSAGQFMQRPWFIGQALAGPIGLVGAWISNLLSAGRYALVIPHSRVAEIGTLYTAVAGMLNLMAIIDAAHRAMRRGEDQ